MSADFYSGKRVFITGVTGFKGTWLSAALAAKGAIVEGLDIVKRDFFDAVNLDMPWHECDVRDRRHLERTIREFSPEVLFHLAAQPIVSVGYEDPVETFHTNVQGTVHVLEVARTLESLQSIVVVTSDKCYRNTGIVPSAFREEDALGGEDPYSASKAAQEIVTQSYAHSFFDKAGCRLTSARAGNTIGGGDFSPDRIIPDIVRAAEAGQGVTLRNPESIRPWQHVLDPVAGYLMLAEQHENRSLASAYNFGPDATDTVTVGELTTQLIAGLNRPIPVEVVPGRFVETAMLTLDASKAIADLGWRPRLSTEAAIRLTAAWYDVHLRGDDIGRCTRIQIEEYFRAD